MKKFSLKLAILSISMLQAINLGISPVLADIKRAFPGVSEAGIMQLLSLPFIFTIPASIISGKLAEKISKKTILIFGIFLTTAAGIYPFISNNFSFILFSRVLAGIGVGLIIPFMLSLIVDFFDGSEREHLFGIQSAFVNLGTIIYYFLGGLLGSINWHFNFLIFIIGLVILSLIVYFLPRQNKQQLKKSSARLVITKKELLVCILVFTIALLISVFTARLSFLIVQEKIGNAATTGIITTFTSVGGFLAGILYGKLSQIINRQVITLASLLVCIGTLLAAITNQVWVFLIAALILGLGSAFSISAFVSWITSISAVSIHRDFVMAVFMSSISLGMSAAPTFTSLLSFILPEITNRRIYFITAALLFVYSMMSLALNFKSRKNGFQPKS